MKRIYFTWCTHTQQLIAQVHEIDRNKEKRIESERERETWRKNEEFLPSHAIIFFAASFNGQKQQQKREADNADEQK